jgi:hypothetical protein
MSYVEAISYTWGSSEKPFTVLCDGQTVPVTRNLRDSLRQVRSKTLTRLLWADSICINQEDRDEQGQQVAMMGEVYGKAKRVLICVGQDPDGHAWALSHLVADVNAMMDRSFANIDLSPDSFPWLDPDSSLVKDSRWVSFKELLNTTWSHRGWCIQEALLAATAQVLWGEVEIPWEQLGRAHQWLFRRAPHIAVSFGIRMSDLLWDDYRLRKPVEAKTLRHAGGYYTYSLLEIMSTARRMGVTDPRDRVYAFLGLHQKEASKMRDYMQVSKENPIFDYGLSAIEVYHRFAAGYLKRTSDLNLLQYVEHDDESLHQSTPSWVPRWDLHLCRYAMADTTWPLLQSKDASEVDLVVLSDKEVQVRGVIFDKVQLTSAPHSTDEIPMEDAVASIGDFWTEVLESGNPTVYRPLSDRTKHLARTLRVGRFRGNRETWDQHESAYVQLICGRQDKSHDERGYGIDVEALAYHGDAAYAHGACKERLIGRKVLLTERGYFGEAPNTSQAGDFCAIIFGMRTPVLLRKRGEEGKYQVLGEAYIESKTGGLFGRENDSYFLGGKDWSEFGIEEQDIVLI